MTKHDKRDSLNGRIDIKINAANPLIFRECCDKSADNVGKSHVHTHTHTHSLTFVYIPEHI